MTGHNNLRLRIARGRSVALVRDSDHAQVDRALRQLFIDLRHCNPMMVQPDFIGDCEADGQRIAARRHVVDAEIAARVGGRGEMQTVPSSSTRAKFQWTSSFESASVCSCPMTGRPDTPRSMRVVVASFSVIGTIADEVIWLDPVLTMSWRFRPMRPLPGATCSKTNRPLASVVCP